MKEGRELHKEEKEKSFSILNGSIINEGSIAAAADIDLAEPFSILNGSIINEGE